jgi:ribokinase
MSDRVTGGVLTAGSINTDLVARVRRAPEAGETITGESFAIYGGGKGANQTLASIRSGARTAILGAVGYDDFGRQRLDDLLAEHVDCASVARVDGAVSGVALITVETSGQNRIAYMPGAASTVTAAAADEAVHRFRPAAIMTTLELPNAAIQSLIDAGRRNGATIIVNATPEPAAGAKLAMQADILIVNESETRELLGWGEDESNWDAAASELREQGPQSVIITIGDQGAVVLSEGGTQRVVPPPIDVVDTTGAGDAFCGAFAAQIARGVSVMEAARTGVIAGALACTKMGAQPSQPSWSEIAAVLDPQAAQG